MNIVLIGMRGSGKSTVAKKLSKQLEKPFIEVDTRIVKKTGTTIPEMVAAYGWGYFRKIEAEVTKEVCVKDNSIISTGGGVITTPENIPVLKKNNIVFYLRASIPTLLRRIGHDKNRPALTNQASIADEMKEILHQRQKIYEKTADVIIDTDKKSIKEIVAEIRQQL